MKWNNRVVRVTVAGVVAGTLAIACMGASAQVVSSKDATKTPNPAVSTTDQTLWEQLRQAEMTGKSDTLADWAVINGMPLAPKVEGIDAEFSAVASVLMWMDAELIPSTMHGTVRRSGSHVRENLLKGLAKNEDAGVSSIEWQRIVEKYVVGIENRETDKNKQRKTLAEGAISGPPCGFVQVHMLKALADTPSLAAKRYWEQRCYQCIERRQPIDVNQGKLLLDNGIPFFIKDGGRVWVCLGYAVGKSGSGHFLAADAARVGFLVNMEEKKLPGAETMSQAERERRLKWVGVHDDALYVDDAEFSKTCMFMAWPCQGEMVVFSQPSLSISMLRKMTK